MSAKPPFIDPKTGRIETTEILYEATPLARLIGLFVVVALVPLVVESFVGDPFGVGVFSVLAGFVSSIGGAIVLIYVITRSLQLAADAQQNVQGKPEEELR
jgi:uncharacterized membrane protein